MISLVASGEFAELTLANTGPGIPENLRERVFARFVRGPNEHPEAIEGSGLGLAICKWIVEAHGGTILLASEPDLTTFTVRLPLELKSRSCHGQPAQIAAA